MAVTEMQQRWAEYYDGVMSLHEVARKAGYKGSNATLRQQSLKNKANPEIMKLVNADVREWEELDGQVATKDDRQKFWTRVMVDPSWSASTRLRASELLGKSKNDFIDKREVKTEETKKSVLLIPDWTPEQWAEYFENEYLEER